MNNNPSMTSGWKRATATFSQIFFNVSAVASIRFFPVHSHRHWKERMHFHIWGLRAWPFFDGKLPGMVCLRTFQNPSTWPVWILTFPLFLWKCQWRYHPTPPHPRLSDADVCNCNWRSWSVASGSCGNANEDHRAWHQDHVEMPMKIIERGIRFMWKCQWRS